MAQSIFKTLATGSRRVAVRQVPLAVSSEEQTLSWHVEVTSEVSRSARTLHFSEPTERRHSRILSTRHRAFAQRDTFSRQSKPLQQKRALSTAASTKSRGVFIALGSNVGDSVKHIEEACNAIDEDGDMRIVDTSCLYRTKPMYVEDQDDFVNGACEIETHLEPMALLDRLQAIERKLGRVKTVDKGPRNIDLDIIGYANQQIKTQRLTVPHALMHERAFVLRPLNDLERSKKWRLPSTGLYIEEHLAQLDGDMQTLTPLGRRLTLDATKSDGRTRLMSILNVTPDSFSDGGKNFSVDSRALQETVKVQISAGAEIVDIGGQSSRPNAENISADEETRRLLPAINAVCMTRGTDSVAISVDTYRAKVAQAAVQAGADIVNDISGGLLDPEMLTTVARLGCTYVAMHMRGDPTTMASKEHCTYVGGVVNDVAAELGMRVRAAIDAGIRRWRIVLDPGLGFAKDTEGNLELLRSLSKLCNHPDLQGIPWLVGSSRKRFIGQITGVVNAADRSWGTAATVTAAIAGGAHIVRVHDVKEMDAVIKMSDAIYSLP